MNFNNFVEKNLISLETLISKISKETVFLRPFHYFAISDRKLCVEHLFNKNEDLIIDN